ncbi:hypothetical protein PNU84_05675 [Turicibacter sanguinis]|nr:hypothetical protein [Turicibacter sanguinis]
MITTASDWEWLIEGLCSNDQSVFGILDRIALEMVSFNQSVVRRQ